MNLARRGPHIFGVLAMGALSGCVTVYQPLLGLQRPVAVDPELPNFQGVHILVRCAQDDSVDDGEASRLCHRAQSLFSRQGAEVEVATMRKGKTEEFGMPTRAMNGPAAELVIDIKSRLTHEENSALWWLVCIGTLTLAPAITEQNYAQDISIRDGSGFVLLTSSFEERFIRYTGAGVWAVNGLLDWVVRSKEERIGGDVYKEDFTRDLYGQLSQLAFNARMRALVLRDFEAPKVPAAKAKDTRP